MLAPDNLCGGPILCSYTNRPQAKRACDNAIANRS